MQEAISAPFDALHEHVKKYRSVRLAYSLSRKERERKKEKENIQGSGNNIKRSGVKIS